MKKSYIALFGILIIATFIALFFVARITFQAESTPTEPAAPDTPAELTQSDLASIEKVATLFVDALGSYSNYTTGDNFNLAGTYATADLQAELLAFGETGEPPVPAAATDEEDVVGQVARVDSVIVSPAPLGTTELFVEAIVRGEFVATTTESTASTAFTGTLSLVRLGGLWFVGDLSFTPPLAGFK